MPLHDTTSRFEIVNYSADTRQHDVKKEILAGLKAPQKYLPSKLFYDDRGSSLFEKICFVPEYYQTRTELAILQSVSPMIMKSVNPENIVELGSGANWKVRTLLEGRNGDKREIRYVPVDVCSTALKTSAGELLFLYPHLSVLCVIADFMRVLEKIPVNGKKLVVLFGSTIGNFTEEEGNALLTSVASFMRPGDVFLLGIDMIKEKELLDAAYNDTQGLTAAFNKNILYVVNAELKSSFDVSHFDHVAFYDEEQKRVEMHLRANREISQDIQMPGLPFRMDKGETILTEISRKFSRGSAEAMAHAAGMKITRWFSDPKEWFSVVEMSRA